MFRFFEQAWQKAATNLDETEWSSAIAGEEVEGEEIECVVCKKSFKSEKAWRNHEQSRKHIKEVDVCVFPTCTILAFNSREG